MLGYLQMLKAEKSGTPKVDGTVMVYPDGTESNQELHEQIMAGVDDSKLRAESLKTAIEMGLDEDVLALLR